MTVAGFRYGTANDVPAAAVTEGTRNGNNEWQVDGIGRVDSAGPS